MHLKKGSAFIEWLTSRLAFIYICVGLISLAAIFYLSQKQTELAWKENVHIAVKLLSTELVDAIRHENRAKTNALFDRLSQSVPISYMELHSQNGRQLIAYPKWIPLATQNKDINTFFSRPIIHIKLENAGSIDIIADKELGAQGLVKYGIPISFVVLSLLLTLSVFHYLYLNFTIRQPLSELLGCFSAFKIERPKKYMIPVDHRLRNIYELDVMCTHINQFLEAIDDQQEKRKLIESELKTHRRNLGKLVQARTSELVELNKRFVQQQFDAKASALEAKQSRWEAEKANQDKTRFLAAASHDLRQPLHAMSLFIEALEPLLATAKAKQIHSSLKRSLETMKELFNALLDISKLEAGVLQPKLESFPIQRIFDHLEVVFRQQAIEKDLDLRIVASKYVLKSDLHLLEQVISNLVSNAIKHTLDGYIFVGCRKQKNDIKIFVWDAGPGIPEDQHDAIFKEFVQLDNPERDRSKGLGLGLSIVKRTCQLLDHEIKFESKLDLGTRFEIIVPIGVLEKEKQVLKPVSSTILEKQRVLVIDDDPSILLGMKALLDSWTLYPVLARSIEDAKRVCQQKPDLIISDLRLQNEVTGVEAINEMHSHFGLNIPAILITGDTSPDRIKLVYDSPFPLLHKPIKPAQLRSVCTSVLNLAIQPDRGSNTKKAHT